MDDDELDALAGLDGEFLLDALLEGFDVNNNNLPASTSNKHSTKASPRVSLPERRFSLGTFMQELETLDVDQEEDEGDLLLKSLQIEVAKSARGESEKEDENDPKYSSEKSRGTTMSENLELLASRKHAYDTNRAKLDMDSTNRDASLRASAFARASGLIERERAGSITSLVNNMLNTHQGAEKEKEKEANTHNNSKGFASSLGDIKEGIGSEAGSPNKLNDNDIDENASNSSLSARDGSMSNDETQRKMSVGSFMFELLAEFGDTVEGDTADTHVAARMDAADQKRREKEDSSKRKDSKEEKEEKEDIERMRKMSVSSSMSHFLDNDGKVEKQKEGDGDNKQEKKNARERLKDQEKGKKGGKVEEERKEREGVTKGGNDQEKLRKLSMNSFISHWTKESVDAETKTEEASQEKVNTDGTDPIESEEERMRKLSVTSFMSQWMDDSEEQEKKRRKKEEDKERASTEELKRTTKKEPERGRQQGEHIPEEEGEESGSERENKSAKESVDGEKSNCGNDPSLFLSSPPSSLLSPRAVAHKSQVARMGSRNSLLIQAALKSPMKERDRGRYGNRMAERFERTSKIDMSMRSTGDCSPGGVADDDSGCEDGNYNREKKNQLQTRHSGQFVPPLHHLDLSYIHLSPVQFTSPEKSARRASRLNPSDMSNTSDGANRSTSTSKSRSRSKSNNNDNHSIHNIDDSRTREHYTSNPPQIRSMSTPSSPALNRHNCSDRYSCKNSPSTVKEDGSDENTLSLPFSSAATVSRVKHPKLYRSGSQSTRNKYSSSSKHGHTLTREIKSARNMRSKSRDRAHGCRRKSTGRRRGAFQTPKRKGGLKTPRSTRSAKNGHRNRNKSSKGAKSLRTNHRNLQIHSARSSRRRDTSRHALRSVKSVRDRSRTPREPSSAKGRRGGAGLGRGKEKFKGSARAKKIQTPGKKNKSTADILKQPESALTIIKIDSHGPDSDDDVINTNKKMDSIQQEKRKHPHSNSKSGSRNLNTDQKDKKQGSQVRRRKRSAEENRRRTRKKKSASKRTSSSSGSNSKSDTDSVTDNASASASFSDSSFSSSVSDDDSEDSFSSDSGTTTASSSESDFPSIACRRRRGNSMHRKDDRYSSRSRRRSRHRNKGQHRSMSKYRKRRKSRHSSEKSRVAVDIYEKSTVETEPVVDAHVTMQKARLAEYVNTRYRKLLSQQRLGRHLPMDMDRLLEERIQQEVSIRHVGICTFV